MALVVNMPDNAYNVPAEQSYTVIDSIEIVRNPAFAAPTEEGGEATLIATHRVKFRTRTYINEEAKAQGKQEIAQHVYTLPYNYDNQQPIMEYLYSWLKENVGLFAEAVNA